MGPAPARMMSDSEFEAFKRRYESGESCESLCRAFGYPRSRLFDRGIEKRLGRDGRPKGRLAHPGCEFLERRQGAGGGRRPGPAFKAGAHVPREEAERRRDAIFRSWSPEEREMRRGAGPLEDRPSHRTTWAAEPIRGVSSSRRLDTRPRNW